MPLGAARTSVIRSKAAAAGGGTPVLETSDTAVASSATSLTVNVPAGTVNGDLLVFWGMNGNSSRPWSAHADWVDELDFAHADGFPIGTLKHRVASSEPASYTFPWTGGTSHSAGGIIRISGAASALDGAPTTNEGTNSGTKAAPAITTTVDNTLIIRPIGMSWGTDIATQIGYPAGHTGIWRITSGGGGGGDPGNGLATIEQATAGTVAAEDWTQSSGGGKRWITVTAAVKPA